MPAYQRWGGHTQSRLPPTPPDYQSSYMAPICTTADDMHNFYPTLGYPSRHPQSARDFNDRYHHLPCFSATMPSHHRSKQTHNSHDYHMTYPHQAMPQYQYGPIAAPMLPPIRATEDLSNFPQQYSHAHPEPRAKEEKPTGGVAQHLDYEMDLMSSFVAEMSQRIVSQNSTPTPQFRKYVSQILSSTRLPSSTIMLGLFYLQERMKILSQKGQDTSSSGTVYRMLTTCLLLGSKFLDDNTFQNRSWAEVSSIAVAELNAMELEWLKDFNWEIHGLMYDKDEGFFVWIEHWHAYEAKAQQAKVKDVQKLTPLETSFNRNQVAPQPLMSPEGPIPPQYQQGSQYDTQWVRPYMSEYSPPSAPDSGPATPEYYANNWSYPQAQQSYARSLWRPDSSIYGSSTRSAAINYNSPYSAQSYGPSSWGGHGIVGHGVNCGCTMCAKHSADYYFSQGGYGMQTVAG